MVTRTRTRLAPGTTGQIFRGLPRTLFGTYSNLSAYEQITEDVGPGDGRDLFIKKLTVTGGQCYDYDSGGTTGARYVNLQGERMRNPSDAMWAHASDPARPPNGILAAKLLAETNPSRPVVDLPIAIYELKDIPSLLKNEGDDLIRKGASWNLKWQFALKPLISDLSSLLNFSDEVAKRQKELDALFDSGLRRKRTLYRGSSAVVTDTVTNSIYKHVYHCISDIKSVREVWGFVSWFPDNIQMMKGDRRELAKKAVLGLTIDFSTAWNAIPWSWLIDWCSNAGTLLAANRNLVGASHGPIQIMETIKSTALHSTPNAGGQVAPGTWELVTKQRNSIVNVPITAHLPILSLRQLSILGSIAVTRRAPKS